jgi:predicted trehalose synthase
LNLSKSARGVRVLLEAILMERCLVDVAHELRDCPDWLPIALESTLAHIAAAATPSCQETRLLSQAPFR